MMTKILDLGSLEVYSRSQDFGRGSLHAEFCLMALSLKQFLNPLGRCSVNSNWLLVALVIKFGL